MSSNKFYLNRDIVEKNGITIPEALLMLSIYFKEPVRVQTFSDLANKSLIYYNGWDENFDPIYLQLTSEGVRIIENIFLNSELGEDKVDDIKELAGKLQEIFPQGRKPGTSYYFRGNIREVELKLKKFLKMYPNFTYEQILNATKAYVSSFNGDYSYMRILPYFILKFITKVNSEGVGIREEVSDLATFIENAGQEDTLGNDWTSILI